MLINLRGYLDYINRSIDTKLDQRNQAKLLYQIFEDPIYKDLINQIDKDLSHLAKNKRRVLESGNRELMER